MSPKPAVVTRPTFAPFRTVVFRNLWLATFAANISMWMNDVTAAWVMTSLTTSPVMVAMVQTASTLPVFLLGLPSGALADIMDRRRVILATQLVLCGATVAIGAPAQGSSSPGVVAFVTAGALTAAAVLATVRRDGIEAKGEIRSQYHHISDIADRRIGTYRQGQKLILKHGNRGEVPVRQ